MTSKTLSNEVSLGEILEKETFSETLHKIWFGNALDVSRFVILIVAVAGMAVFLSFIYRKADRIKLLNKHQKYLAGEYEMTDEEMKRFKLYYGELVVEMIGKEAK